MIKRIKKIQKLGIFDDYNVDAGFNDFACFNLFYGWNGCGKTTLSRLFSMLDKKVVDSSFADCEFEVILNDDSIIKSSNLAAFNNKIFVFNQHFIEENIDWKNQGAKSIVVISEEKIEERKKYFTLKDVTIPARQTLLDHSKDKLATLEKERERFLTSSAKGIKISYQLIATSDSRYMNYDRGKLRSFIDDNKEAVVDPGSILNETQLEELRKKLHPIFKPAVELKIEKLQAESYLEREKLITSLLDAEVVSEVIDRLKAHQDINNWVQEGLSIHQNHESSYCEFCTQEIPAERVATLKRHFSDQYSRVVNDLNGACDWLDSITIATSTPDSAGIYDEFKDDYVLAVNNLHQAEVAFSEVLLHWKGQLQAKLKNVFSTELKLEKTIAPALATVQSATDALEAIVKKHNEKSDKFTDELNKSKSRVELHFVASVLKDNMYFNLLDSIASEKEKLDKFEIEVAGLEMQKKKMEAELANVAKGAEDFNAGLHRFLGRNDISLVYDIQQKGYKIIRAGQNRPAHHLSEGEKTAIAFVYFSIKIKENGNKIEDCIVVVDDPISSFDSTYLFNSYSYLKHTCERAKQVFVLTHNFQYFKLVRDWMMTKNKHGQPARSVAYSIDVLKKQPRQSALNNAHETLLNHGSEYHFFFRKLYSFKDAEISDLGAAYQVANYARKMLEAFFSFKHPKKRDFYGLMSTGCKAAGIDQVVIDRVYKFINTYSHHQIVEFHESTADNILSEGYNVTADVLLIMSSADKAHYDELVEMCG